MTTIRVLGSGSSGNGYLIESGSEILIVELGLNILAYMLSIDDVSTINGCIVTHRHHDHMNENTVREFVRRGIPCYAHEDVIKEGSLAALFALFSGKNNKVGQFSIQTFKAPHDVPNYGFLITTPTKERIVFLTDTTGVNIRFKNIDCIMVECNHDDDTIIENMITNEVGHGHPEHHMNLDDCATFCKVNYSATTKKIILIHTSSTNLDESKAVRTIRETLNGFNEVHVAKKGDVYQIESDSF